ncbi:MAG TPA: formate dehydrogenase accessory sulfurtransferase FdhD [Chitinophagaceae bacterium]|nr:formate dehydrogenase accessory sulfurtransferase FdhD [Chitinophagaceae bacterium]
MEKTKTISIQKFSGFASEIVSDKVITESPLQIVVTYTQNGKRKRETLAVTMRTPGDDFNMVAGFLFCEGIIKKSADIMLMKYTNDDESSLDVELGEGVPINFEDAKRNFLSTSACGFCGKLEDTSQRTLHVLPKTDFKISADALYALPALLKQSQGLFGETGGVHAVALINLKNEAVHISEDVGRHNAMDKLAGAMLKKNLLPLSNHIVLFSGRLSYELVQKSIAAGITVVCSIGAPSSLALELAEEYGITVIGFLKNESCNIYCGQERIIVK